MIVFIELIKTDLGTGKVCFSSTLTSEDACSVWQNRYHPFGRRAKMERASISREAYAHYLPYGEDNSRLEGLSNVTERTCLLPRFMLVIQNNDEDGLFSSVLMVNGINMVRNTFVEDVITEV